MDALFDVQDSTLNSSLAEILANLAEAEATATATTGPTSGRRSATGSPLLMLGDHHEILSNSLQEFLGYEDPHSPILVANPPRETEGAGAAHEVPSTGMTASRSPRFAMQRNPSFTPSLKGFLFSKDDGVVGRIETTTTSCSLTGSGSDSSDPAHTYLPRLTDGSVSVLHSLENNDLHDLSSLEDSMRSGDDTSSSSMDRDPNKVTEVVDLGPVKEELEKNLRNREHDDRNVLDSPAPVSKLEALESKQRKRALVAQRRAEALESSGRDTVAHETDPAVPAEAQSPAHRESRSKSRAEVEGDVTVVPQADDTVPISTPSSPATAKIEQPTREKAIKPISKAVEPPNPPSNSPPPAALPMEHVSEQTTATPAVTKDEAPKTSPKSSRRSSLGNDASPKSPTASPSRRSPSKARRSSIGSSSSRPRRATAAIPVPTIASSSPKGKSASRSKDKVEHGDNSSENAVRASPQVPDTADVPPIDPKHSLEEASSSANQGGATQAASRAVGMPSGSAPKSPKSPHRELRLKIQIDEMRSPKQSGDVVGGEGTGTDEEALPQMLKMLLDGVANKIRKHAKQESMRKIRSKEGSSSQDVESPARSVRQVVESLAAGGTSDSPRQRIKVRIDKSKVKSPRKDGNGTTLATSKSGRRHIMSSQPEESENDFDPHAVGKSDASNDRETKRDPSQSPRRHKDRSSEKERSRSRSGKSESRIRSEHHSEDDWDPQEVARAESVKDRPKRRSMDRVTSSRRMSGAGHDERARSKSSSKDKDRRSSRSQSKGSTATPRSRVERGDDNSGTQSLLKAKLDEGAERFSRASGSRSVCSKSSRRHREESYPEEDRSHHRSSKASTSAKGSSSLASTIESGTKKQSGLSSSRSVCSRSSRKKREGSEEGRLSRSYHSRSVHSGSKSVRSSSRSVHSASKSSSKSRTEESRNEATGVPRLKSSASSHDSSDVTETIEYDFNDDVPTKGDDVGDRRGRSYRRGSGSSISRGRSQSARHLGSEPDASLKKSGRSQSQRYLPSERASSLSSSRRSQSHRHLKSGEEAEYKLGLGIDASKHGTRSSSQPPSSSRQPRHEGSRAESLERSGPRRSRSRPATDGRKELSLSGLSRSQIEEGAKSVASSASDRTPRRSGGRGPSPNARSRIQPTSLLSQSSKGTSSQHAPEPPGRSPVTQTQAATTVSRLRGVQKALSFRDLFARDPDPWQEFTSPTRQPKPSCLPVPGATTSIATAPSTTKGRSMPKFLSAVGNSFQRSASARFPEVTKSELDASFESFHPFETSSGGPEAASDKPPSTAAAETVASTSSSSTASSSHRPASGPSTGKSKRTQPSISERSGPGWTQKFFR